MQIMVLLGMYFDAVVVEGEKYLLFFQIGSGHTVYAGKNSLSERILAHYISPGRRSIEFMTQSRLWPPKERPALSYFLWMQWRYLLRSYKKVLISVSYLLYFFPFDMLTRLLAKTRHRKRENTDSSKIEPIVI